MSKSYTFDLGARDIRTTVITHESALEEGLKFLLSTFNVEESEKNNVGQNFERVVGLDTEKSFSSTSDGLVSDKVALLKLCSENDCLLVHLTHFKKIPTSLAKFLNLSDVTFVGMCIKHNLNDLQRDYGVQCRNVIELGPFAAAVQKKPILSAYSLPDLFKFVFRYPKWEKTFGKSINVAFSDWGASTLSLEQIWHASMEVHATIMIVNELIRYYS
ncbi:hypothetical protein SO802_001495 [Lithocarpus litseifolius]|uniref:3'-5' exonuclease domain-containing protein n=1 Tax=Lithocarpus litseifolius TaxID=425828 RepID=A0AAW2DVH6_9ROSI